LNAFRRECNAENGEAQSPCRFVPYGERVRQNAPDVHDKWNGSDWVQPKPHLLKCASFIPFQNEWHWVETFDCQAGGVCATDAAKMRLGIQRLQAAGSINGSPNFLDSRLRKIVERIQPIHPTGKSPQRRQAPHEKIF
jgi:hypothetical protein